MLCHIGFLSDFRDYDSDYFEDRSWAGITGIADTDNDKMWVFVDQIAFLEVYMEAIMIRLSNTTVHELIHLCGVLDEDMTYLGVKLAK